MITTTAPPDDIVVSRSRTGWTWHDVPTEGHVAYVALGRGGDVLYVGQTCRPRERLREHVKSSYPWRHDVVRFVVFPVSGAADALLAECRLIEELRPAHNRRPGQRARLRALLAAEYAEVSA